MTAIGHLIRDQKGARRDREFYEELIALRQRKLRLAQVRLVLGDIGSSARVVISGPSNR